MYSLTDLLKPYTRDKIVQTVLDVCTSLGLPITSWQPGATVRTMLVSVSQKLADFTVVNVELVKSGFGDYVTDAWAPIWAKERFDVDVVEAEAATGFITAVNASLTQYDCDPGELIVAHRTKGSVYRNQSAISILAGATLEDIAIQADVVGTASDAAPDYVTVRVSSQIGVTVTNPAAVLGADRETTPKLVARGRAKMGSVSPLGPKDAYRYVATTPARSATSTPMTRVRVAVDEATGTLTTYIASADGAPTAGDVAIVQAAQDDWAEPWCTNNTAVGANNLAIAVTYHAWVSGSNLTADQIKGLIADALAEYLKGVDPGGVVIPPDTGSVYVQELEQAIGNATPGIVRVLISLPAADVSVATNQVPVLGTVTATVTLL